MLQTRSAKRTAAAALKAAVEMVERGPDLPRGGDRADRPGRSSTSCSIRVIDPSVALDRSPRTGLNASPGRRQRRDRASTPTPRSSARKAGTRDPRPLRDDAGRHPRDDRGARAILTAHGGMTSHAAVVARGMGKPCVAGCEGLESTRGADGRTLGGHELHEGDVITIDGGTGRVYHRRGAARPAAAERGLRDDSRLGRRACGGCGCARTPTTPEDARAGARVRRRGDRPLPHRAHVLRRGAAAGRAGDDPRRRRGRTAARRSTGCCRSSRPTSRGSSRRWPGCR